uniref:Uncharacterized protein n=1 Tax=Rhizophora mucronata TaxID=61149 RepID=A0A2P2J4K4_RHIMU
MIEHLGLSIKSSSKFSAKVGVFKGNEEIGMLQNQDFLTVTSRFEHLVLSIKTS